MKTDQLLNLFQQKGLKAKNAGQLPFDNLNKNLKPIDSGMLISIKGGNVISPLRGN